ncbi:MAG TPA: MFS transporter [Bacillota bacterium]|nr:MFS transporter [Bacillota bacterium]
MDKKTNTSQGWAIALFTIGVFMAGLDNGIISTALTTISNSFEVSPSWGAWSITLYTLGVAISVPIIGKFSDRYGRRRLFLIEVTLFGLGSLLVALSPNFVFLLAARFIQAIGGGGIFIIGSSHILSTLPKKKQGRALGLLGGMHGLSAVIGPNLGSIVLTITGSWHWMFLINLPIAAFLLIVGYFKIEETKPGTESALDFGGIVLLSGSILAMMIGFTQLDSTAFLQSITHPFVFVGVIGGILLFMWLINHERNVEQEGGDPILSFSLLRKRPFQLTMFLGLLSGGFLAGIIFIPAYVQQVFQIPAEQSGFWVTPLALASGIGAGLGGFLTDRISATRTVIVSGMIGVVGFSLFPLWVHDGFSFTITSIIAGVGFGILLGAPLNVLVGDSAKETEKGSALGTLSLVRQVGLTLFPTIYAGFITGGFTKAGTTVVEKFPESMNELGLSTSSFSQSNLGETIEKIETLPNEEVRTSIIDFILTTIKSGYNLLFIVSSLLAILVIGAGYDLHLRKKESLTTRHRG